MTRSRCALPGPQPRPVAESVLSPYPCANHGGDGHGWRWEGTLGVEKELVLDSAPNPEWHDLP